MMGARSRKPGSVRAGGNRPRKPAPVIRILLPERQFADVVADRLTFEQEDIVVWLRGTEVARHHVASVDALEITFEAITRPRRPPRRARLRQRPVPLMLPKPWGAA